MDRNHLGPHDRVVPHTQEGVGDHRRVGSSRVVTVRSVPEVCNFVDRHPTSHPCGPPSGLYATPPVYVTDVKVSCSLWWVVLVSTVLDSEG